MTVIMPKHRNDRRVPSGTTTVPLCPAMKRARISDPDSPKGIEFCTERCPYPEGCIAADDKAMGIIKRTAEKRKIRQLHRRGMSIEDIANTVRTTTKIVHRCLQ